MVWDKELFFPAHEEDATVTRVFESLARFDEFRRMKVMKRGELFPVEIDPVSSRTGCEGSTYQ